MLKYKFIDSNTVEKYDKKYVIYQGKQISHPSEFVLLQAGYKNLQIDNRPKYNMNTHRLIPHYNDMENYILKTWVIEEIPEEERMMFEDVMNDE